jgi:hypothetical protein
MQSAYAEAGESFRTGTVSDFTGKPILANLNNQYSVPRSSNTVPQTIQATTMRQINAMYGPGGEHFTTQGGALNRPGGSNGFMKLVEQGLLAEHKPVNQVKAFAGVG